VKSLSLFEIFDFLKSSIKSNEKAKTDITKQYRDQQEKKQNSCRTGFSSL